MLPKKGYIIFYEKGFCFFVIFVFCFDDFFFDSSVGGSGVGLLSMIVDRGCCSCRCSC
jgi:hypothetical protein